MSTHLGEQETKSADASHRAALDPAKSAPPVATAPASAEKSKRESAAEVASPQPSARLLAAYKVCGDIARREARNFYYAFRALPGHKRDAICAVYAFMRHADDVSDDESRPHAERHLALDAWLAEWHTSDQNFGANQAAITNPVFLALADARRRFNISTALLDELVEGTAMDLNRTPHPNAISENAQHFDLYPTFEDLYGYCYLVASVVGLVCIRIFGYEDARAEKLAEETGIAFQLTNILRDVREDAERGRIYLPVEDMQRLGVTPDELAHLAPDHHPTLNQRELLAIEAGRAEHYYQSAQALLPLIAADSRPALWVLATIYHRLLQRIRDRNYDVFTEKVRLPTPEKLWILARGLTKVFAYRLGAR